MKDYILNQEQLEYFVNIAKEIVLTPNYQKQKEFFAHGKTTVFDHQIHVAYLSFAYAISNELIVDYKSLIRGALLHDYYLYDWHKNKPFTFHGFKHNRTACKNACRDYELNKIEKNIILSHMFPFTLFHYPKSKEALIVSKMDKRAASLEHREKGVENYEHIFWAIASFYC